MELAISLIALLITFFQLHLQRAHNEKSLKPLGQIDLSDRDDQIHLLVSNNGLGPLIIDNLSFMKEGKLYANIESCLDLNPRSYRRIGVDEMVKKVVLPNYSLEIFVTKFEQSDSDEVRNNVKRQLAEITLKVSCRDIYDNKIFFERNLAWFSRHIESILKT